MASDEQMHVPDSMGSVDGRELAHGLLLAVLRQHHGGTVELDTTTWLEAMGDANGSMYAIAIEGSPDQTRVRLSVVEVTNPAG